VPAEDKRLEEFTVVQRPLNSESELGQRFEAWKDMRAKFNQKLFEGEPAAVKAAWQRYYFRGEEPTEGAAKQEDHVNKRRLAAPISRL